MDKQYLLMSIYDVHGDVSIKFLLKGNLNQCLDYLNKKYNKNYTKEQLKNYIHYDDTDFFVIEYTFKCKHILAYCEDICGSPCDISFFQSDDPNEIINHEANLIEDFNNKRLKDHTSELNEYINNLLRQKQEILNKIRANYGYDLDFNSREIETKYYFDVLYNHYSFKHKNKETDEDFIKRIREIVSKDGIEVIEKRMIEWKEFMDKLVELTIEDYEKDLIQKDLNGDSIVIEKVTIN